MNPSRLLVVGMVGVASLASLNATSARAQDRGLLGGLAGGIIGGIIAGGIAANARQPAVVYRGRSARYAPARPRVAKRAPGPGGSGSPAVINASADPFAKAGSATTAVSNTQSK